MSTTTLAFGDVAQKVLPCKGAEYTDTLIKQLSDGGSPIDYLNVMVHVCDSFLKDKRLTLPHVGSTHQTLRAGALRSRPYAEPPRRRSRLCAEPPSL